MKCKMLCICVFAGILLALFVCFVRVKTQPRPGTYVVPLFYNSSCTFVTLHEENPLDL